MAHPDDVDFGIAGSVATWTDAGIAVDVLHRHRRRRGRRRLGIPRSEMGPLRRDEQRAAAAVVGVDEVHFLGYPDGRVEATLDAPPRSRSRDPQVRPQRVVVGMNPVATSTASTQRTPTTGHGIGDARRRVSRRAQSLGAHRAARRGPRAAHRRRGVAGLRPRRSRRTTPTSPTRRPQDRRAVVAQEPDARPGRDRTMVRSWLAANAELAGLPEGRFAEIVRVVETR